MKVLILPSTTGQGDLAVANRIAAALDQESNVNTVYFAENEHSPLLREIEGTSVLFPSTCHPNYSQPFEQQIIRIADEISRHAPDVIISLNDSLFTLGSITTRRPVIHLTHFLDRGLVSSGRSVLKQYARAFAAPNFEALIEMVAADHSKLFALLRQLNSVQPSVLVRILRKARTRLALSSQARVEAELASRFGPLLATGYLGLLLCDEMITHSIFPPQNEALKRVNRDRHAIGKSPIVFTRSLSQLAERIETSKERPRTPTVLLTFGGIDHVITPGMQRLMQVMSSAAANFKPGDLEIILAGRVIETKRAFFENCLSNVSLFQQGYIKLVGSVDYREHLRLIKTSDLVLSQPGYSTLCELVSLKKPFILFYGLAPYYEQLVNFLSANQNNFCIRPGLKPWMQVGEYGQFNSQRAACERSLIADLTAVFNKVKRREMSFQKDRQQSLNGQTPDFTNLVALKTRLLSNAQTHNTNVLKDAI